MILLPLALLGVVHKDGRREVKQQALIHGFKTNKQTNKQTITMHGGDSISKSGRYQSETILSGGEFHYIPFQEGS
jgi:hypothetical protein